MYGDKWVSTPRTTAGFANVAAAQTDSSLVAAVTGKKVRVVRVACTGDTAVTTIVFNSKPGGAGAAISATFNLAVGTPLVLPTDNEGWFQTAVGEGLTVTTGAGGGVRVEIGYVVLP